jgi:hypothetical protein
VRVFKLRSTKYSVVRKYFVYVRVRRLYTRQVPTLRDLSTEKKDNASPRDHDVQQEGVVNSLLWPSHQILRSIVPSFSKFYSTVLLSEAQYPIAHDSCGSTCILYLYSSMSDGQNGGARAECRTSCGETDVIWAHYSYVIFNSPSHSRSTERFLLLARNHQPHAEERTFATSPWRSAGVNRLLWLSYQRSRLPFPCWDPHGS